MAGWGVAGDEGVALSCLTWGSQQRGWGRVKWSVSRMALFPWDLRKASTTNTGPRETTTEFTVTFHFLNSPIRVGSLLSSLYRWGNWVLRAPVTCPWSQLGIDTDRVQSPVVWWLPRCTWLNPATLMSPAGSTEMVALLQLWSEHVGFTPSPSPDLCLDLGMRSMQWKDRAGGMTCPVERLASSK